MKAAIRLEISKKDEEALLEKVHNYTDTPLTDTTAKQELITYYRFQLHRVFKMGLATSTPTEISEST